MSYLRVLTAGAGLASLYGMTITASAAKTRGQAKAAGAVRTALTGPGARTLLREAAARCARPDGHGRGALVAYGALAAVDLLATATAPRGARRAAKPLLMPALASYTLRRRTARGTATPGAVAPAAAANRPEGVPDRASKALLAGLACATVGDTALLWDDKEAAFLTGMAAFLGTQLSYTAGMAGELGGARGVRERPGQALGCLGVWAVANAALAPTLPARLRLPTAGYSLALVAMGAAALGVGGRVAVGAVSFLGSDLLIGLQAAGHEFPGQEVLVMAGYILGQYLIVTGWPEAAEEAEAAQAAQAAAPAL